MCGLFGVATDRTTGLLKRQEDYVQQAMYVDALRGWDSTGLAVIDSKWNASVFKRALPAADFALTRVGTAGAKAAAKSTTRVVIGHNRAATVGSVTDDYAHPFKYGNVVGAHNGTLRSRRGLVNTTAPVDSMDLIHAFSEIPPDEYADLLSKVDGAYALTWVNGDTERLYFARNSQRPLTLVWHGKDLYWGSEAMMVYWLMDRNKIDVNGKDIETLELETNTLYTYDPKTGNLEEESYTPKTYPVKKHTNSHSSGARRYVGGSSTSISQDGKTYMTTYINAEGLLKRKLLCDQDMKGWSWASDISFEPYPSSNGSHGALSGKWYYDSSNSVRWECNGVPKEIADKIINDDAGSVFFTPTGGDVGQITGKLVCIRTSVKYLQRCTSGETGSTDGKGTNIVPFKKEPVDSPKEDTKGKRLVPGTFDHWSQEELDAHLDRGCSVCSRTMGLGDLETMAVYNNRVVCGSCADEYEASITSKEDATHAVH